MGKIYIICSSGLHLCGVGMCVVLCGYQLCVKLCIDLALFLTIYAICQPIIDNLVESLKLTVVIFGHAESECIVNDGNVVSHGN